MADSDLRHKLAAILAADVAGYSRLMSADEAATVGSLDAARAIFRAQVEAHRGRVNDMVGDAALAVFDAATGAVAAALDIQREINALAAQQPEDRRMRLRIGIHLGDVIEKADGTVYGDGVNIAARLESLAEQGGITVSAAVHEAARKSVSAAFEDLGEQQVKNIPYPVRAYRVAVEGAVRAAPVAPKALPLPDKPSIAVLPFTNMSGDPEQEYFADGVVEDIITALSRVQWFFVIARNSSFTYKGRAVDIKQVGRELGVRYVLEGSIRKAGNRVRITGQLIEAATGHHVWADRFEGTLEDIFDLQDRITESVVGAIEPNVRQAEFDRIRSKPTSNLDAYDLCLRATGNMTPDSSPEAREEGMGLLRRAIEIDPKYSLAKGMLAFMHLRRVMDGIGGAEDVKGGLRLAEEALADHGENPTTLSMAAMVLASLGYRALGFRVVGFRYDEALRATDRALSLSSNLSIVLFAAGIVRTYVGDADVAIAHFQRALRLSPRDKGAGAFHASIGVAHVVAGRYEEALAAAQTAIQESPGFSSSHRLLIITLSLLGRMDEAKEVARRYLEMAPGFTVSRYLSVTPNRDADFRNRVADALRAAGLPEK